MTFGPLMSNLAKNIKFKLKNRKKILKHGNIRYSLSLKKLFSVTCRGTQKFIELSLMELIELKFSFR